MLGAPGTAAVRLASMTSSCALRARGCIGENPDVPPGGEAEWWGVNERMLRKFARFGYAVIPLDLAGHLAHNMFHLLAEGRVIFYDLAALIGVSPGPRR